MSKNLLDVLNEKEKRLIDVFFLHRGQIYALENDICDRITIVIEGTLNIVSYTFNGSEIIYNSFSKNDVFGNNLLFSSEPFYKGTIMATSSCKIASINKKNLLFLLHHNEQFLIRYLQIQSDFGKSLNFKIKLLSFPNAEDRFQYYLYMNKGSINYNNVTSLSNQLFMKRETLSRLLSKLVNGKKIIRKRHTIKYIER